MRSTNSPDDTLIKAAAILGLLGSIALVGSNIYGSIVVPDHDWIADTVSDLGAGRYEYIQDIGLYGYAFALTALSLALAHLHTNDTAWNFGLAALAFTAIFIVIIGARNEYGDNDSDGVVVHIYLVYAMGFLFTVAFFCFAEGLDRIRPRYRAISYVCGVLWAVGAVIFFVMPTAWDGIWERGLGLITVVWVLSVSRALWSISGESGAHLP